MSYLLVLKQIERILNECGDSVRLIPTRNTALSQYKPGDLSVELLETPLKIQNDCFAMPDVHPMHPDNPDGYYIINRIRLPKGAIDDMISGNPYSDEEMREIIMRKEFMFGYYNQ